MTNLRICISIKIKSKSKQVRNKRILQNALKNYYEELEKLKKYKN